MRQFIIQRMMAILEEKNLSERQVSMDLGYSDSYMNKVKNGSIALTIDFLEEFCNELNVRPEEFFALPEAGTPNQYLLLQEIKELPEEDIQCLYNLAKFLGSKNRQMRKKIIEIINQRLVHESNIHAPAFLRFMG